ncbi:MAG TPA: hypothetical protein DEA08_36970 [Planctomycetes bacterium]|nr:hypothetical protein [Planctomycetota bacterium]
MGEAGDPVAQGRRVRWLLALILLVAAVPRLAWLGSAPPALHPDEAATAADALELPRAALSFAHERGGRVEGTYTWLAWPGLRLARATGTSLEVAARLPAALAGIALVAASFALGRGLGGAGLGLAAALVVALLPWGWHFSRLALRATLVPTLVVAGLALWTGAPSRGRLLAGGLLLGLGAATYPPARLLIPPLALAAWFALRRERREILLGLGPSLLVFVALLPWTLWGGGSERVDAVAIWRAERPLRGFAKTYGGHFAPRFLFGGSSSRGFAPEGVGLVPHWLIPLLIAGLLDAFRRCRRDRRAALLLVWIALFPLAAALTQGGPNALRAVLGLPALGLLAAWGARAGWRALAGQPRLRAGLLVALALVGGVEQARLARAYFVTHPREQGHFYRIGSRELVWALAERARRGEGSECREEFLGAYLRLYAPSLATEREGERWRIGPGPTRWTFQRSREGRVLRSPR